MSLSIGKLLTLSIIYFITAKNHKTFIFVITLFVVKNCISLSIVYLITTEKNWEKLFIFAKIRFIDTKNKQKIK